MSLPTGSSEYATKYHEPEAIYGPLWKREIFFHRMRFSVSEKTRIGSLKFVHIQLRRSAHRALGGCRSSTVGQWLHTIVWLRMCVFINGHESEAQYVLHLAFALWSSSIAIHRNFIYACAINKTRIFWADHKNETFHTFCQTISSHCTHSFHSIHLMPECKRRGVIQTAQCIGRGAWTASISWLIRCKKSFKTNEQHSGSTSVLIFLSFFIIVGANRRGKSILHATA